VSADVIKDWISPEQYGKVSMHEKKWFYPQNENSWSMAEQYRHLSVILDCLESITKIR